MALDAGSPAPCDPGIAVLGCLTRRMPPLLALLDPTWVVGDLGCGTGQVSEALAPFVGRVVAVDTSGQMLEAARARLAQGQGFYAIDLAKRAQMVAPKDWRPLTLLAIACEQSERDAEALAAHRAAVTLAPDQAAPLANLAMFQAGQGDLATAETLLRQAVTLKGAGAPVRLNLALVLGLRGELAEAEALSRQDLPPDQAASNIAWLRAATAKPSAGRSYEGVTRAGS